MRLRPLSYPGFEGWQEKNSPAFFYLKLNKMSQLEHVQALKSMNVGSETVANFLETKRKRTALGNIIFTPSKLRIKVNPNQRQRRKMWAQNPSLRSKK